MKRTTQAIAKIRQLWDSVVDTLQHQFGRKVPANVAHILKNPSILRGKRPEDIAAIIEETKAAGWEVGPLGRGTHKGQGLMLREVKGGKLTGRIIQWHPGGGHHGDQPYWKVSTPEGGTVRIGPQFE